MIRGSPTEPPQYYAHLPDHDYHPSKRRKLNDLSALDDVHGQRGALHTGESRLHKSIAPCTVALTADGLRLDLGSGIADPCSVPLTGNAVHDRLSFSDTISQWNSIHPAESPSWKSWAIDSRDCSDLQTHGFVIQAVGEENVSTDERLQQAVDQMICYGMLIDVELEQSNGTRSTKPFSVFWNGTDVVLDQNAQKHYGKLPARIYQIMETLSSSSSVQFEIVNQLDSSFAERSDADAGCQANIIVYGALEEALNIGDWLSQCDIYLQQPFGASQDVPYRNPQSLDFDDDKIMLTSELVPVPAGQDQEQEFVADNWSDLEDFQKLDEADQPPLIRTILHRHQKQALTFLQRRERGWDFDTSAPDIWKSYTDRVGRQRYRNVICGESQAEPPPLFQGGCLADPMGLGKTLSVLSLIALCPARTLTEGASTVHTTPRIRATLIVVPASLVQVWETQIGRHFYPSAVQVLIYHGPLRRSFVNQLAQYDIVITTYNSVAEDRKASKNRPHAAMPQTLLSVHWHRVVLDEAHMIRSKSTANARAVRALEADHRWAVTGTPIQNRLTDFANLLAFLRVHPFDNAKYFESEISQPWKAEMNESSLRRLQILAATLCLRRPKAVVELTASFPIQVPVVLQPEERESYEAARAGTLDFIDHELNASGPRKAAYFSAFQRINDLRYVCNHGTAPKRDKTKLNIDPDKGISKGGLSFAQQLDQFLGAPALICLVCGSDLGDSAGTDNLDVCYQERGPVTQQQVCKGCVATSLQIASPGTDSGLATPGSDDAARSVPTRTVSSKVRALMTYIERTPRDDKCVVFSYWTASLDLIQSAFEGSGISYSRYDGSLSRNRRDAVLVDFAKDPSIKVILISITCGGQGLDVTIANHAILLEPQWNPMLEEQALSRVHRIGQVKPVYLVRLVVQESFEENIVSLQERKRTLAGLVVDQQKLKAADGKKLLLHLRELVG